ncbi:hypothetical protein SNE25_08105 [Mucilaginibacter sabulilitoris]|uniref:Outer membrane protein beta-barrel domain-containing protein n=1 Tax=Mucilaginibacter sabulilitoris TaxID=1173583 RepID=A0ABZ0TRE7_9SPHI|nr:hypothetical protein [Mucilaginibacter sabulilitoris]WPU95484.1 hypothetical protein SNE25_08105 [Mucilaginibacter sabulilitoris]
MKKTLLVLAAVCGTAWSSFAQTTTTTSSSSSSPADHAHFSTGLDGGVTLGGIRPYSKAIAGASVQYEMPIATNTLFTASAGYSYLLFTDAKKRLVRAFDDPKSGASFIPMKVGLKYYVSNGFFVEGQAGVVFALKSKSANANYDTAFAWSGGAGYTFKNGLELSARYENWSNSGVISQAASRVAYRF